METMIRKCKVHGQVLFVYELAGRKRKRYWRCKECRSQGVARYRRKQRKKLLGGFGDKCEICGYDKCIRNLEFHHVFPETKSFAISAGGLTISLERKLEEAKKCILACSNCHGEIEDGILEIPKHLVERVEKLVKGKEK